MSSKMIKIEKENAKRLSIGYHSKLLVLNKIENLIFKLTLLEIDLIKREAKKK